MSACRVTSLGSSPLARGTLFDGLKAVVENGLIPARAGNTSSPSMSSGMLRAHPRSRGEHVFLINCSSDGMGSSPLARGTPSPPPRYAPRLGLIPARAGNTSCAVNGGQRFGAHPRSRGEHMFPSTVTVEDMGSSPLARGTLSARILTLRRRGLIPARAGNTLWAGQASTALGAHPRSRGEHLFCCIQFYLLVGSSPLARGTLRLQPLVHR